MTKTSLGLKKPEGTDLVNIQDMNDNMDVIEKELQARVKTTGDIKDTTVAFTQAASRTNITTGEKMSVIMGKIRKFFADLTAPAFAQMITTKADLMATKATGYVPDAKAVADAVSEVNGKLISLYDSNGVQKSKAAIVMSIIPLTYLDSNTCMGIIPIKNVSFNRDQMIALVGLNNDYNVPTCTVTAQIVSATQINIYARSNNVNAFTADSILYASCAIIGTQ